jgi:hypothetical protein
MHTGLLNSLEKLAGGKLFHCRFCRIQFWDRRRLQSQILAGEAATAGAEAGPIIETAPTAVDEHNA